MTFEDLLARPKRSLRGMMQFGCAARVNNVDQDGSLPRENEPAPRAWPCGQTAMDSRPESTGAAQFALMPADAGLYGQTTDVLGS